MYAILYIDISAHGCSAIRLQPPTMTCTLSVHRMYYSNTPAIHSTYENRLHHSSTRKSLPKPGTKLLLEDNRHAAPQKLARVNDQRKIEEHGVRLRYREIVHHRTARHLYRELRCRIVKKKRRVCVCGRGGEGAARRQHTTKRRRQWSSILSFSATPAKNQHRNKVTPGMCSLSTTHYADRPHFKIATT